MMAIDPAPNTSAAFYRTIWRWHFYAGLFVLPFILILSVTGAVYLFKPQIDRWEERAYQGLSLEGTVSPERQLEAALASNPDARFQYYRLPEEKGDAAMIQIGLPEGGQRDIFVSPQGKVLGAIEPGTRISDMVALIHGSLLLGTWGDRLVELAASWTIVLIFTGLYLWWPRPFRAAGALWPRLSLKGRPLLKDIHRVTGFWIAGLVLVMLASGLPWAGVWGGAFDWARTELGLIEGRQDWKIGAGTEHDAHDHHAAAEGAPQAAMPPGLPLSAFVVRAEAEKMAPPVLILPPHTPQRFGPPTGAVWTVKSETQNRPLARQISYDPSTGAEVGRSGFADKHVIDRVVSTGIAWHEGQLFGLANQLLGLATAIVLIALSLAGVLMWLKRRPHGKVGSPPSGGRVQSRRAIGAVTLLAVILPLFGASLLLLLIFDKATSALARRRS
ncbi:PepSY-associated TM helix domain-containing protein [Allosphingosinicella vermicomposti]|uniref:PepSY-associated TM helix domain-containing protein n=1 Tax=Allosphingosinicella vermicomposti TaxID=614671 RepID=UPI001FE113AC|nr:PepSY domain-containing protein [Allosphingosinicella vermicomposti]